MPNYHDLFLEEPPFQGKIVCLRDSKGVHTNVPHLCSHHSPTGYEFSYGGSGPADLALNIVENILRLEGFKGETMPCSVSGRCFQASWQLHQSFKWTFIAPLPKEGAPINFGAAQNWVLGNLKRLKEKGGV